MKIQTGLERRTGKMTLLCLTPMTYWPFP